jgi:hypothetical protein
MSTQSKFNALDLLSRIRAANATASSESKSYNPNADGNLTTSSPESNNFQNIDKTVTPMKEKKMNSTDTNSNQPDDSPNVKRSIRIRGNLSRSIDAFRDIPSPNVTGAFSLDDARRESFSSKRREKKKNFEYSYQDQVDSYGNGEFSKQIKNIPQHLLLNQNASVSKNKYQYQNQDQGEDDQYENRNQNQNQNQNDNENDYISSNMNSKRRFNDSSQQKKQNVPQNNKNVPQHTELGRSFKDVYDTDDNYGTGEYDNMLQSSQNHGFDQNMNNYHENSNGDRGYYSNNNYLNNQNNSIKKNNYNNNSNNSNNDNSINNDNNNSNNSNNNNNSNDSNRKYNNSNNNRYVLSPGSDESFNLINDSNLNQSMEIKRNFNSNRDFECINSTEIVIKNSPFTEELYNELNKLKLENDLLIKKNRMLQNQKNEIEKIASENKTKNDDIITNLRGK